MLKNHTQTTNIQLLIQRSKSNIDLRAYYSYILYRIFVYSCDLYLSLAELASLDSLLVSSVSFPTHPPPCSLPAHQAPFRTALSFPLFSFPPYSTYPSFPSLLSRLPSLPFNHLPLPTGPTHLPHTTSPSLPCPPTPNLQSRLDLSLKGCVTA